MGVLTSPAPEVVFGLAPEPPQCFSNGELCRASVEGWLVEPLVTDTRPSCQGPACPLAGSPDQAHWDAFAVPAVGLQGPELKRPHFTVT